jgi:pimeloyl-ACP methyl ester carboxylesterase
VLSITSQVAQRVLLIASSNDLIIPSRTEGPRLKAALSRCRLQMMPGRSHALMQV